MKNNVAGMTLEGKMIWTSSIIYCDVCLMKACLDTEHHGCSGTAIIFARKAVTYTRVVLFAAKETSWDGFVAVHVL